MKKIKYTIQKSLFDFVVHVLDLENKLIGEYDFEKRKGKFKGREILDISFEDFRKHVYYV